MDFCAAAHAIRGSVGFLTVAEEADIAARVVPGGFGSLFEDLAPQRLVVFLKDLSKTAEAEFALRKVLPCGGAYPGWSGQLVTPNSMSFLPGQYSGTELLSYLQSLQALRTDSGVWAIEVDPETNRIWIGLRDPSELTRIQQIATAAGVPLGAVMIEAPPEASGTEQFVVLDEPIATQAIATLGVFEFAFHVRFTNRFQATRYPDQCFEPFGSHSYFLYTLEKWDAGQWKRIYAPVCDLVAASPRPVAPGQTQTDSIPVAAVRRLNALPIWRTARITGTYRFVGSVYLATIPNPPFVGNPAPTAEQLSAPFRIVHTAPF